MAYPSCVPTFYVGHFRRNAWVDLACRTLPKSCVDVPLHFVARMLCILEGAARPARGQTGFAMGRRAVAAGADREVHRGLQVV